jgi:hypothetical protein
VTDAVLSARLAAVEARLAALEALQQPQEFAPEPEVAIRIQEACRRAGWSYSWAVRHWRDLGGYKDHDGRLKIRPEVLARHAQ